MAEAPATTQSGPPQQELTDTALAMLRGGQDTFAAIEYLATHAPDAPAVLAACAEVFRKLYWTDKNLPLALSIGRTGAQLGLAAAAWERSPERARALRSTAKGICYDLASFAWPDWDEPNLTITASDLAVGMDAARANLRLARELNKGDLPLSRAYWMLGAHHLATRDLGAAREAFGRQEHHAAAATSAVDVDLSRAYLALAGVLARTDRAEAALADALAVLRERHGEDGKFFAEQVETARRVFARP